MSTRYVVTFTVTGSKYRLESSWESPDHAIEDVRTMAPQAKIVAVTPVSKLAPEGTKPDGASTRKDTLS